jgi:hypothetical protein
MQGGRRPPTTWTPLTSDISAAAIEKPAAFSRDASNSSRNSQLYCRTLPTAGLAAAETIETSQISTSER